MIRSRYLNVWIGFIILLSTLFAMNGCSLSQPAPTPTLTPGNLSKDYPMVGQLSNAKSVSLYYPAADQTSLVRIVRQIQIIEGGGEAGATLRELLRPTEMVDYSAPFLGRASVAWSVVSRSVAIINIAGDFTELTDRDMFSSIVSITNTLCQLNDVDYVEILINGETLPSRGLLDFPMTSLDGPLHTQYLIHQDLLAQSEDTVASAPDQLVLYYLDHASNYLLAEVRAVEFDPETMTRDIFQQLKNSPHFGSGMVSCIPDNVIMPTEGVISQDSDDNTILTIELESPKYETMNSKTRYMMAGAITMTMQGYIPEIDFVRVLINGQSAVSDVYLDGETFRHNIGELVTLYMPDTQQKFLYVIRRAMRQQRCYDPKERLLEMLKYPEFYHGSITPDFPQNIVPEDFMNVAVNEGTAVVNITSRLYDEIASQDASIQRMFTYAIVNTLTEFDHIHSVQFIIEGKIVEKFGSQMYIESPLIPNAGIIYN